MIYFSLHLGKKTMNADSWAWLKIVWLNWQERDKKPDGALKTNEMHIPSPISTLMAFSNSNELWYFPKANLPIQYLFFSKIFLLLCHFHFLSLCIILLDEEESSSIIRPSGVSPSLFNFRLSYRSEGNSWLRSSLSAFFCLLSFLDNFLVFTWHLQRLRKNLSLILLRRSGEVHRPN